MKITQVLMIENNEERKQAFYEFCKQKSALPELVQLLKGELRDDEQGLEKFWNLFTEICKSDEEKAKGAISELFSAPRGVEKLKQNLVRDIEEGKRDGIINHLERAHARKPSSRFGTRVRRDNERA